MMKVVKVQLKIRCQVKATVQNNLSLITIMGCSAPILVSLSEKKTKRFFFFLVSEKATDGQSESNDSNSSKSSNRELVEEKQDEKGSDRDEFKPGYKPDVDGCVIENSKDYRLMCYVNFARTEGLSAGTLQRLDALMETLYGAPPVFTVSLSKRPLR